MECGLERAPIATGFGVQQLMNRLTDHLWLYHKAEASCQAKPSSSTHKAAVVQWFVGLTVEQRQQTLLVKDREWIAILMQMQRKLVESGPTNFFLMLDMGNAGARSTVLRSMVPELLCRRPVGLLARLDAQNSAGKELTDSLYFFSYETAEMRQNGVPDRKQGGSKKGKKNVERPGSGSQGGALVASVQLPATQGDQLDVMVVAEELVEAPQKMVQLLDCLTLGQFLQEPCRNQAPSSWDETPWLHSMGYCALPYYVANRIELAIWSAWLKSTGCRVMKTPSLEGFKGKALSRAVKPLRSTPQLHSSGPSAVSILEKQRTLQTWWQKLDAREKLQVLQAGTTRLASHLAAESLGDARTCRDLRERGLNSAVLDELGSKRQGVVLRASQHELASGRKALQKVPWIAGLLTLQELSESGLLPEKQGVAAHIYGKGKAVGQLKGRGQGLKEKQEAPGQRDLEKELQWILLAHGSQAGANMVADGRIDGLFCPGLDLACTLRGRLLSRLRHLLQQLMQEHIARDLLDSVETGSVPPRLSKVPKTASGSSKASKKKSACGRSVSGLPAKDETQRSAQSDGLIRPTADRTPGGASQVEDRGFAQPAQASLVGFGEQVRTLAVETALPGAIKATVPGVQQQSVITSVAQGVNTPSKEGKQQGLRKTVQLSLAETPAGEEEVNTRGPGSLNETDDEERRSSSGEAWEEVGAAKRRKDRRRRIDDKVAKREPRKRAAQPLEATWMVSSGHVALSGGVEAEGEHRKRRRRRKGKERKKEDAADGRVGPADSGVLGESGLRQTGAGISGATGADVREKPFEMQRHRGWNLAAPVFEPRLALTSANMVTNHSGVAPVGLVRNQVELAASASCQAPSGLTQSSFAPSFGASTGVSGGSVNRVRVEMTGLHKGPNVAGRGNGTGSGSRSPGSPQEAFKRSLSAGNPPGDESAEGQSSTADSKRTTVSGPPLVVPITPLKPARRSQRVQQTRPSGFSNGVGVKTAGGQSSIRSAVPLSDDAHYGCHEWPQLPTGLAGAQSAGHSASERFYPATPALTRPPVANRPLHVTGFVVQNPRLDSVPNTEQSQPPQPTRWTAQDASGLPASLQPVGVNQTFPSDYATGHVANLPPSVPSSQDQAASAFAPPVPFSDTGVLPKTAPFRPAGDLPPASFRPVAIHRSRSSHQLPDNGYPVDPPGPVWEADHYKPAGRSFAGGTDSGGVKAPEQWPVFGQPGVQSLSPEAHWPPNLPRITVPTADYFTDEDWLLGGGDETEGSLRNGNNYDVESEAEANGRYVVSETEVEGPRSAADPFRAESAQDDSRIDYSRIFDGGVLYWTADNYSTLGPSRPNSLSSNDSMWMRREADISFIVDDIAGASFPGTESPTSLAYVAADVTPRASPAPSERAASPLPAAELPPKRDPPEAVRRMPRVRAVRLQGSRPSPILVRTSLAHTPPRSVYRGLSPDLQYTRGLSPDTFVRHLPNYQAAPLARQGSVGAPKDGYGGGVRWKRPTSPVLRFSQAPPAVPTLGDAPRARPANARSGSSSPRHWAPALDGRDADKASGVDAEGTFRGTGPDFSTGAGVYTLGEKLAAVVGSGGFGRNPLAKKGLPPLAPVTHSSDQEHPDVLVPVHHWVTVPTFNPHPASHQEPPPGTLEGANLVTNPGLETRLESSQGAPHPPGFEALTQNGQGDQGPANLPGFGDVTSLQPVVLISPLTPISPPLSQQPPADWALFHDLLHKEVERFCTENREEMACKRPFQLAAITKVSKALQVLWPRSRITVFGSFITGLALPTSDIDLLVGLPPVRSLEPIKEAGILEGRNGIKETMLQHAARYLADQDWVKTDSMKTIENTAVPIIQLVAQMPLQPLQSSGSPGEKNSPGGDESAPSRPAVAPPGIGSPSGESSPQKEDTAQNRAAVASPRDSPVGSGTGLVFQWKGSSETGDMPTQLAQKTTAATGGVLVSPEKVLPESGAVASALREAPGQGPLVCARAPSQSNDHVSFEPSVVAPVAHVMVPSTSAVQSAREKPPGAVTHSSGSGEASGARDSVRTDGGESSIDLSSVEGAGSGQLHLNGPANGSTVRHAQKMTGVDEQSQAMTGVYEASQEMTAVDRCSGLPAQPGAAILSNIPAPAVDPAAGSVAPAAPKSAADVRSDVGISEARAAPVSTAAVDVKQGAVDRGLDGRRHSAPQKVLVELGSVTQADVLGASWRGHVAPVRTRADVASHVEGAGSPSNQERRLVKLDISFEGVQHTGSRTTDLVRELVAQFPPLPPLVLVLKQFLTDRSLDHPYTGGLSSYCLVLLVTRFLQHQQHVSGVRAQQAGQNLGLLLMDFLHFFGCVFDPRRMGVSIRAGGMYIDRDKGHSIDPLYIEDPLNPLNNVGRNCFRILQCTKAFGEGYVLLSKQLNEPDANTSQTNLFSKILTKCAH